MPSNLITAIVRARTLLAAVLVLVAGGIFSVLPALAQSAECDRLQATIASLPRGGGGDTARFGRAATKQRSEIGRTETYARSLGCDRSRFSLFGEDAAPQCAAVQAQLQRMRGNLAQLENAAGGAGGGDTEGRRRQLMARYNANCGEVVRPPQVAAAPQRPRDRGFFENLFGSDEPPRQQQALSVPQPDFEQIPLDATQRPPRRTGEDADRSYASRGGNVAVCVRTCDGSFFPVSYSAGRADSEDLSAMCTALCPNTPVAVYTYNGAADIETAVSLEGEPYRSLPTALRYRTTFDSACACRAANQSWVAALAEAEKLLVNGGGGRDQIVSEQKAAELSRPKLLPVTAKTVGQTPAKVDPVATGAIAQDAQVAKLATTGAAVPTAGQETAGISAGDGASATTFTREQGRMQDIILPSGVKRRVRIVGPKLEIARSAAGVPQVPAPAPVQ